MYSNYKRRYLVKDSLGYVLRVFDTYKGAMEFKISRGRMDWRIVEVSY